MLTTSDQSTYRHEIAFRGSDIFEKRSKRLVVVCGAGALGSNLINLISRQGFTNLQVIDKDKVESHNIANQLYGKTDVGAAKVRACANRLLREVGCKINAIQENLTSSNAKKLLRSASLVVDTFDNFESRQVIKDACNLIPCVHAGMSDSGFSEVKWNESYNIPKIESKQNDVCEYPLALNSVYFTVSLLSEVICLFIDHSVKLNIDFTLKDLTIFRRAL